MKITQPGTRFDQSDPQWAIDQLVRLLKHGARAERLNQDAPELVPAFCPAEAHPDLTDDERADRVEKLIRESIDKVDLDYHESVGQVMRCLLGLTDDPALQDAPLRVRTEYAARAIELSPRWFRSEYRDQYILAVGSELHDKLPVQS